MAWIRRYKLKSLFPKFQLIQILRFLVMHDYMCFIAPIDYCVAKSLVHIPDFLWKLLSFHTELNWFQPNSFAEMCFLENDKNMQKIQILKILWVPSTWYQGVCL